METNLATADAAGTEVMLRALATRAEFEACVRLQQATWGEGYADCVPASILKVSQLVGGVSGGAFVGESELVGFVYGLTGVRDGRLIHWSHMLAVLPAYRNHGVGRRLKEYQRAVVRRLGVETISWTFDPLVARNAHLNLNRLGAVVDAYVPDMYGDTGSTLHAFGTDRFVVSWQIAAPERRPLPAVVPESWRQAPVAARADALSPIVRIEIPRDVENMSVVDARMWREATRREFVRLLEGGYRVRGFLHTGPTCAYVLERRSAGLEQ